jgi:2-haloacid dehalogenase
MTAKSDTQKSAELVLFDVNETLLDMSKVKKKVNSALGSKNGSKIWFGLLLQYSLVDNVTNQYHNFTTIAEAALEMAATKLLTKVDEKDKKSILQEFSQIPPHKDVKKGLELLQKAGYRLATLTNSPASTLLPQLENGDLKKYFETTLSVDDIQKYKPSLETYQWAAKTIGLEHSEIILVAAHGWDITGAACANMQTAFVARKGQELYPLAAAPTYTGKDLVEVAKAIINHYSPGGK